ncbi:MAG: hypothetical protein HY755_00380 [Nitrospirae bacterium]|nr:hypothetical protein [Nitrospirota bacterium]
MDKLFLALSVSAICIMVYALVRVFSLSKKIPGGTVGASWKFLSYLVVLFTIGYLSTPFFPNLPEMYRQLIVGIIFLAGAVFVVIVINLFYKVIRELGL